MNTITFKYDVGQRVYLGKQLVTITSQKFKDGWKGPYYYVDHPLEFARLISEDRLSLTPMWEVGDTAYVLMDRVIREVTITAIDGPGMHYKYVRPKNYTDGYHVMKEFFPTAEELTAHLIANRI